MDIRNACVDNNSVITQILPREPSPIHQAFHTPGLDTICLIIRRSDLKIYLGMPRICSRCWLVTVAKVQMVLTDPDINKHSAQVWAIFVLELHIPHNLSSVGVCKGRILMDLMAKDKKRNNITMQLLNILSRTIRAAFSNSQHPSCILTIFKSRIEPSP